MSCKVVFCPCCAHLTSASDAEVAKEQGGVVRRPVLVALHTSALHHHRQHDDEGRLLLPEVQTDAGQGALRGDAPGYGEGQVCPSPVT